MVGGTYPRTAYGFEDMKDLQSRSNAEGPGQEVLTRASPVTMSNRVNDRMAAT